MADLLEYEQLFWDALYSIRDSLREIVIVGGWCPYLYSRHLWKQPVPAIPTTLDIDLGVKETGPQRFALTVHERLQRAGFPFERIYAEEPTPVEFMSRKGNVELKLEFITSFFISDDTLNRFLGRELACNRLDAFEFLLEHTLSLHVAHKTAPLVLNVPEPAAFMYHKGISFTLRGDDFKKRKDLFYLYFILRYCPGTDDLLRQVKSYQNHELYELFKQNVEDYLGDYTKPGYEILAGFLRQYQDERTIAGEIKEYVERLKTVF